MSITDKSLGDLQVPNIDRLEINNKNRAAFDETQRDLIKFESKITLLLNEEEEESKALIAAMQNYRNATFDDATKLPNFTNLGVSLVSIQKHTRSILRVEWKRAKAFNGINH
jgi:hypothetical protein